MQITFYLKFTRILDSFGAGLCCSLDANGTSWRLIGRRLKKDEETKTLNSSIAITTVTINTAWRWTDYTLQWYLIFCYFAKSNKTLTTLYNINGAKSDFSATTIYILDFSLPRPTTTTTKIFYLFSQFTHFAFAQITMSFFIIRIEKKNDAESITSSSFALLHTKNALKS